MTLLVGTSDGAASRRKTRRYYLLAKDRGVSTNSSKRVHAKDRRATRQHLLQACLVSVLLLISTSGAAIDLLGQVVALGAAESDPPEPLANTRVSIVGAGTTITNASGRFKLGVPYAPGAKVRIEVRAEGLVIYRPHRGEMRLPKTPDVGTPPDEVTIELLPLGSKRLLDDETLRQEFEKIARESLDRLRPEGRPDEIDFTRYLEDLGHRLGFSLADVERAAANWRRRKQADPNADPHELGLVALSEMRFDAARRLFRRSRLANEAALSDTEQQLAELQSRLAGERRLVLRDLLAEARAASLATDPAAAIQLYEQVVEQSDREQEIDVWAHAVAGLAGAHRDLANASFGSLARHHIDAAVQSVQDAIDKLHSDSSPYVQADLLRQLALGLRAKADYVDAKTSGSLFLSALAALETAERIWNALGEARDYSYVAVDQCDVLSDLGGRSLGTTAPMQLADAVSACDAALWLLDPGVAPLDWAWANNSLGAALRMQGIRLAGREGIRLLQESVHRHKNALEVYDKDTYPHAWAKTQTDLGLSLTLRALRASTEEAGQLLQQAIDAHRDALSVRTRESLPKQWASTSDNLGFALSELAIRTTGNESIELLRQAIDAHRDALGIIKQDQLPQAWARSQNNLGHALAMLGIRSPSTEAKQLLDESIEAQLAALSVCTKDAMPQDWARLQNNLGVSLDALAVRVRPEDAKQLLREATDAYRAALSIRGREALPQDWALTQNNLGHALISHGMREDARDGKRLFTEAAGALTEVLAIYTRESQPQAWAEAKGMLGRALTEAALRSPTGEGRRLLNMAIDSYRAALSVQVCAVAQEAWALTQNNLGHALAELATRSDIDDSLPLLGEAIDAHHDALAVRTEESTPHDWAVSQNNLGHALANLALRSDLTDRGRLLDEAISAYRAALTVYTKRASRQDWARTQNNLGHALASLAVHSAPADRHALLHDAISAHEAALTVRTRDSFPLDWALTQNNLAGTFHQLGGRSQGEVGKPPLREALDIYRATLAVYTREALPEQWANTKRSLADSLASLGLRTAGADGDRLLSEAVAAYNDALTVHTRDAFEEQWTETKEGLREALAYQALYGTPMEAAATLQRLIETSPEAAAAADAFPKLEPRSEIALRLLELATLTRLAGEGAGYANDRLMARRRELGDFLASQPEEVLAGHTFWATVHYLETDSGYAPYRDTLLPMYLAAHEGRSALLAFFSEPDADRAERMTVDAE
jgi:hypothetical protein